MFSSYILIYIYIPKESCCPSVAICRTITMIERFVEFTPYITQRAPCKQTCRQAAKKASVPLLKYDDYYNHLVCAAEE